MASNESDDCKKEVGDETTIGSAGAEVLSSDESSSTTSSSRSSEAEDLRHACNMPHLIEEDDAPEISRGKQSSSSPFEYAHVRYGREVVLVKWKEA